MLCPFSATGRPAGRHTPCPAATGPNGTRPAGAGSARPGTTVPGRALLAGEGERGEADACGLAGALARAGPDPAGAAALHEATARLVTDSRSRRRPRIPMDQ